MPFVSGRSTPDDPRSPTSTVSAWFLPGKASVVSVGSMVVKNEVGEAAGALELEPQVVFYVRAVRRSCEAQVHRLSTIQIASTL